MGGNGSEKVHSGYPLQPMNRFLLLEVAQKRSAPHSGHVPTILSALTASLSDLEISSRLSAISRNTALSIARESSTTSSLLRLPSLIQSISCSSALVISGLVIIAAYFSRVSTTANAFSVGLLGLPCTYARSYSLPIISWRVLFVPSPSSSIFFIKLACDSLFGGFVSFS